MATDGTIDLRLLDADTLLHLHERIRSERRRRAARRDDAPDTGRRLLFERDDRGRARFLEGIRKGLPLAKAAAFAGWSRSAVYAWRKTAEDDPSSAQALFWLDVEHARAEGEAALVDMIREHAPRNWQAAAWILERRNPNEWGRGQDRIPEPEQPDEDAPSADDLRDSESLLRKAKSILRGVG